MANEDVLGPRKTMFVLVIVVGCFAVLWPRILSPLILGNTRDQLKPNQYDREAGCCEVVFEPEVAVLELVKELCSTAVGTDGRLSALAAAQCRKSVNETCGVDIIEFLKRTDNVGKSTKKLLEIMKIGNSSCLRENFGVPVWSFSEHSAWNTGAQSDTLKQERPPIRGAGPHPALRERGRAIPAGAPTPPSRVPVQLPPHVRVRSSPLSVYFDLELDIKPPPIPGMRPPLGSPGGPVPAPKSSMGFVMPIYTICIIVFFVYTLSKILFKRTGSSPYEPISPDPQFRRRVFRDDSRTTPDTKLVVTAISGLVAEVQQQMEANYAQSQQRQEAQENHTRPYTNGMVNTNPPVQIIATEYREPTKEKSPQPEKVKEPSPEPKEITSELMEATPEPEESTPETKEPSPESKELSPESNEPSLISKEFSPEPEEPTPEPKESTPEPKEPTPEPKESTPEPKEPTPESKELSRVSNEPTPISKELSPEPKEPTPEPKEPTPKSKETTPEPKEPSREITPEPDDFDDELIRITENIAKKEIDKLTKASEDLINEARGDLRVVSTLDLEMESDRERRSTSELLEEALKEDSSKSTEENDTEDGDQENGSVKVVGMEVTAHSADGGAWPVAAPRPRTPAAPAPKAHEAQEVKSIYLETEIPQQSRVLVTDFVEDTAEKPFKPTKKHSPLVVSGKMTLSLIQDAPRDTPERDTVSESTMDEFTTASAVTQPAAEKQDDLSEEEIEEEIEIEEIEEEVEEEEEEPQETVEVRKKVNKVAGDD